jgi:hypothetical protein
VPFRRYDESVLARYLSTVVVFDLPGRLGPDLPPNPDRLVYLAAILDTHEGGIYTISI